MKIPTQRESTLDMYRVVPQSKKRELTKIVLHDDKMKIRFYQTLFQFHIKTYKMISMYSN